ncbi:MAG: hypothetical protein HRU19_21800 [Pseudobacteriovorax sp.]|nr:hypothetical protein [Pseudobacteriovorax sp.]
MKKLLLAISLFAVTSTSALGASFKLEFGPGKIETIYPTTGNGIRLQVDKTTGPYYGIPGCPALVTVDITLEPSHPLRKEVFSLLLTAFTTQHAIVVDGDCTGNNYIKASSVRMVK